MAIASLQQPTQAEMPPPPPPSGLSLWPQLEQQQQQQSQQPHTPRQPSFAERKSHQQQQQQQEQQHARRGSSPEKGQSRFLEGSMNDRVSAVPPPEFITGNKTEEEIREWERQFYYPPSSSSPYHGGGVTMSTPASPTMSGFGGHPLMRPRSSLQVWGGGYNGQVQQKKSSGFLAPLWDGVREKLRGSRSSGSMEGVMMQGQGHGERAKVVTMAEQSQQPQQQQQKKEASSSRPASPVKPSSIVTGAANGTSYPSREEVLASYKSLQASGFFSAHAIKGTRHPLRNAASAPMTRTTTEMQVAGTMSPSGPSSPTSSLYVNGDRRSFADRLAAVNSQQQLRPAPSTASFRSPAAPTRAPPPPPPEEENSEDASPSRGTKRPSQDIHGEQETATRKLVKKLRRSNSRTSTKTNFTTQTANFYGGHHHHHHHKSRPSTSSAMSGFSLFGGASLYTTTSTVVDPEQQTPTQSPSKSAKLRSKMSFGNLVSGKLTKEKKEKKEKKERTSFLGGLRRKTKGSKTPAAEQQQQQQQSVQREEDVDMGINIPAQVAQSMVQPSRYDDDDDEMMLDEPYITPHPTHYHVSNPHPHPHPHPHHHVLHQRGNSLPLATLTESSPSRRNITPPTSAFYTSHGHQPRIRRSLEMELENEVVIPDANRGIPKVPKIPRTYYTGKAVVVDIDEERRVKRESLQVLMGKQRKHRDSGMSGFSWGSGGRSFSGVSGGSGMSGSGQENRGEVYVHPSQSGW
ncbi:hypothetical protein QC761_306540 [Podospora bellae-mahoneyi]|uniref:Uncharacterized protein n=1 Tax=Podospora bellae-mahoneyi TaxID=2093777 RepID=A0ABR0FKZ8_9PEZI|nr:hypothetical protein QC761_306540 [Podospora bellae-mahoneyi]